MKKFLVYTPLRLITKNIRLQSSATSRLQQPPQKKKKLWWLFLVTLSSILCNLAFFFPFTWGFLISVGWLPLYRAFTSGNDIGYRSSFLTGCLWGILFFGPHFIWFAHLLLTTSSLSLAACFLCYSGVVLYYAVAAGIWLILVTLLGRSLLLFLGSFLIYFHWITSYSLWFFTHVRGYPFLSLLLPLIPYAWFLGAQRLTPDYHLTAGGKNYKIIGMRLPCDLWGPSFAAAEKRTPLVLAQFLYHTLTTSIDLHTNADKYDKIYIMAPESTFPYPIENFPELVSLLQTCLPPQALFIFGSIHKKEGKSFQSLFCLTSSSLTCWYDKKVLINGTEIGLPWGLPSFFHEAPSFTSGSGIPYFLLENAAFILHPSLCAEAFIEKPCITSQKACVTCSYLNDAWFLPYMQELMLLLFRVQKARDPHCLHLYIAHSRIATLSRF